MKANVEGLKRTFKKGPPRSDIRWIQGGIGLGLLFFMTLLLLPRGALPSRPMSVGDIVPRDIKANRDLLIEDIETTAKIKDEAAKAVQEVFDLDPKLPDALAVKLRGALEKVRKGYEAYAAEIDAQGNSETVKTPSSGAVEKNGPKPKEADPEVIARRFEKTPTYQSLEAEFFAALRLKPTAPLVRYLKNKRYDPAIAEDVGYLLRVAMEPGLVNNKKLLEDQASKGIAVQVVGEKGIQIINDITQFHDLEEVAERFPALAAESKTGATGIDQKVAVSLARALMEPNLTVNKQATESLREKARQDAKPVYFQIKKGEMIAREGERLTPQQVVKIRGLAAQAEKRSFLGNLLGVVMLVSLALTLAAIYLLRFRPKLMESPRKVILIGVILLGTTLIIQAFMQVGLAFSGAFGNVESVTYFYAIPFATGSMLAVILLDFEVALLFAALTAFFSAFLFPQELGLPMTALVGGLVASFRVRRYRRRSSIMMTGLLIGLVNGAVIVPLHLLDGSLFSTDGLFALLMGIVGGLISGVVVSAGLPLLESLFNITSDIKLLELGDLDHPLLRQLVMRAPGTYHHSVVVSSLAEEAAEMIGANPLLVRVAAYYHDIGKILKPEYFIENQTGPENKHDRLAPRMSALILISHVKDGVEMARRHNLPDQIIDFIPQHHGTSLISYFYNKAKQMEVPGQQTADEGDFRYPGPKPQSRETGILLLADAVEAASRTLQDPTPARIQGMVRNIVTGIFAEGQLDNCELTLRDLNLITNAFVRILMGIFHQRVVYPQMERPGQIELEAHLDADINDKSARDRQAQPALDRGPSPAIARPSGLPNG